MSRRTSHWFLPTTGDNRPVASSTCRDHISSAPLRDRLPEDDRATRSVLTQFTDQPEPVRAVHPQALFAAGAAQLAAACKRQPCRHLVLRVVTGGKSKRGLWMRPTMADGSDDSSALGQSESWSTTASFAAELGIVVPFMRR